MEEFIELLKNFQFTNAVWVLMIPVSLMGIDVLTGYLNAWLKHDVKSYRMRQGLVKKCGEILVLLIGKIFEYGLGLPSIIMNAISFYIILMELVSVIENLDKIGVPIPKSLKKGLHQMSDSIQNDDISKDKEG